MVPGPISRPISSSSISLINLRLVSAFSFISLAVITSIGKIILSSYLVKRFWQFSSSSFSTKDEPMLKPAAFKKVKAIPPPISK